MENFVNTSSHNLESDNEKTENNELSPISKIFNQLFNNISDKKKIFKHIS